MGKLIKRFSCVSCAALLGVALLVPAPKVEAKSSTAALAIATGVAGAMIGAGVQKACDKENNRHHGRRQRVIVQHQTARPPAMPGYRYQTPSCYQKQVMKDVLARYSPAYHQEYIEYVMIDLSGHLTPCQQQQLIDLLNLKRANWCQPLPPACGCR